MSLSVTQFGKPLPKEKYTWDEDIKVFSSKESHLVIDFGGTSATFTTANYCIFNTGANCVFTTGHNCIFDVGNNRTFDIDNDCISKTGNGCTFTTGNNCTFATGSDCIFKTGNSCIFTTNINCTFDTGRDCVFNVYQNCTFTTGTDCIIVRKDIFEVIKIPEKIAIKLNRFQTRGFTEIKPNKTIVVDGKTIEITNKGFEILKKSLLAEIMNDDLDNAVYMASLRMEVPPK